MNNPSQNHTLRVAIRATHLSQREAAEFLNIRQDTVSHALRGKMAVPDQWLHKLRGLSAKQKAAAEDKLREWELNGRGDQLSLDISADDEEALAAGWPSLSAEMGMLSRIWSELTPDQTLIIIPCDRTKDEVSENDV